jgi:hypothetical protein
VSELDQDLKRDKQFFRDRSGMTTSDKQSLLNNTQGEEAEKVEESLRDFIGKIIGYYEKFNVGNSLFGKYEKKISLAETLLEVFDLMKEMFEELMQNVLKESKGLLDCSDVSQTEPPEREVSSIIYQFEKEIKVMALREKELVRLAAQHERDLRHKEKEMSKIKEKYDEVRDNCKVILKLSDMTYYTENLLQENKKQKKFIEDFQLGVNLFPDKGLHEQNSGYSMKEQLLASPTHDKIILNKSVWDLQQKPSKQSFKGSFKMKENCFKKVNSDVKGRKVNLFAEKIFQDKE